jgi:glycosyltransferase involved in cell wall biosynthesis
VRILILVDCYYPSPKSSAKLVHDLGVELHRRGNEVIVLTPCASISDSVSLSVEDDLRIIRVKTGRTKGAPRVLRAMEEAQLSFTLWRKAKRFLKQNECDLILFYSPSIFFGPLVRRLKALWGCPGYLILRDIFPGWAVDAGILRKGPVFAFFRYMEKYQYDVADLIAVQSPGDFNYFAHAFPKRSYRLKVLHNWTLLEEGELPRTDYRSQLGLKDKFVFVYGGNLGIAQDIDNLIRLATRLAQRTDIHFVLVGSGSEVARLNTSISKLRLLNIHVLPPVSQTEYLSLVSESDAGLVSLNPKLKNHNIPGKLLSYLYWGLPVLASVNEGNDLFELINNDRAGFCLVNGEDENLALAAQKLVDEPNLRSDMGRNARRLLEQVFSVADAGETIFNHLQEEGFAFHKGLSSALIRPRAHGHYPLFARLF